MSAQISKFKGLVNAIAFAVLDLVLIVRPSGLIGRAFYAGRVEV